MKDINDFYLYYEEHILPLVIVNHDREVTSRRINFVIFAVVLVLSAMTAFATKSTLPLAFTGAITIIILSYSIYGGCAGDSHQIKMMVVKFFNDKFSYRSNNTIGEDRLRAKSIFNFPVDELDIDETITGKVSDVPIEIFFVSAKRFRLPSNIIAYIFLGIFTLFSAVIGLFDFEKPETIEIVVQMAVIGGYMIYSFITGGKLSKSYEIKKEVFRGIVMSFVFNKNFSYTTYGTSRDLSNSLSNLTSFSKIRRGFAEVELESDNFMKEFEVYSQNQQEARYLLTPMFMEALCQIKANLKKPVNFSFSWNAFYITFEQPQFENSNILKLEDNFAHMAEFYYFLENIFDIVNELQLDNRIWTK